MKGLRCYTSEEMKKRHVIPIDFPENVLRELQREAEAMGIPLSTYVKHLIHTHQSREKKSKKKIA